MPTKGPDLTLVIPEQLSLTSHNLDENLTQGRGDKVASIVRAIGTPSTTSVASRTRAEMDSRRASRPPTGRLRCFKDMCKQKMASFKAPGVGRFVADLPKTGRGKTDKRALVAAYP
jgi:acyl-CoA synthetase (AMP-forming)/AMP-acid ligase II